MKHALRGASSFILAAWLCLCSSVSQPVFAAAGDPETVIDLDIDKDASDDGGHDGARTDANSSVGNLVPAHHTNDPASISPAGAIRLWLDRPIDPDDVSSRVQRHRELVEHCRELFRTVGRTHCGTIASPGAAEDETLMSAAVLLAQAVNRLIEHRSVGHAARVLPLFLVLESCSDRGDVDASPLLNYAAFAKLYQPSILGLSEEEVQDAGRVLWDVFYEREDAEGRSLLESVLGSKGRESDGHLSGPKWDAFVELSGYNLALLQYHDGHDEGSRRTHEAIVLRGDRRKTWNEGLREMAAVARAEAQATAEAEAAADATKKTKPLIVLTCASDPNKPELKSLIQSAERVTMKDGSKLEMRVLNPSLDGQPFPGTHVKAEMLLAETSTMRPDQLVLFLDAYDTLLFPSVRDLPDLYQRGVLTEEGFREVVFGAERSRAPYPDPGLKPLFDDENSDGGRYGAGEFRYLNSGTILGTASALYDMASEVTSYPSTLGSDQRGYSRYYLTHRDRVGMDVRGRAFLTLHALPESSGIDLITGEYRNEVHRHVERDGGVDVVRPAAIHGNGGQRGGKEYYRRIVAVAEQAASFPWGAHLGVAAASSSPPSQSQSQSQWVTVHPPPFTFAGLAEEEEEEKEGRRSGGGIALNEALDVFRAHVRTEAGKTDVEALMYLAGKLVTIGVMDEAQECLDAAVRADEAYATELYERARRGGGGSLF